MVVLRWNVLCPFGKSLVVLRWIHVLLELEVWRIFV